MPHTLAKQPSGQFQIIFTVDKSEIKTSYDRTLSKFAENIEIEGFRKGKAPLDKVEAKVGKEEIYDQVVHDVLPKLWAEAIEEYKLMPIINPHIRILKAAADDDWQFEATSTELPTIKVDDAVQKVKGMLKSDGIWTPGKDGEEKPKEPTEDEKLVKIFDSLLANSEAEIPEILVNQESDRMLAEFLDQIQKLGMTLDQYLQSLGKTAQQVREEYQQRALEQLKLEFILSEISKVEKIEVKDKEINDLIDSTPDPQLKEAWNKPENKRQLHYSLIKRKTVDHLLKLAS